jgi:hypothetical protein
LLAIACTSPVTDAPAPSGEAGVKKYIVMLEGRNFIFEHEGEPTRFGFSTSRDVTAANPEEAERLAIQDIRGDDRLNAPLLNDPSNPPRITVTHHIEVESFDPVSRPNLDYIFYEDRDTR